MHLSNVFGKTSPTTDAHFKKKSDGLYKYLGATPPSFDQFKSVLGVPTLVGIEIEVENMKKEIGGLPDFWMQDHDGSLRNGGMEFKSVPLNACDAFPAIDLIWKILHKTSTVKPDFSWRSSIHFHINAMDLEQAEMKRWIQLALLFEGVFFAIAGADREQSVFCVPLCRSSILEILRKYMLTPMNEKALWSKWNAAGGADGGHGLFKYAAINFSRLGDLGTVEFRHLGGTNNVHTVYVMLAVILSLFKASIAMTNSELENSVMTMNSEKSYAAFVKKILGAKIYDALGDLDYEALMSGTVLKVKEIMTELPVFTELASDSSLGVIAEATAKRAAQLKKGGKALKK